MSENFPLGVYLMRMLRSKNSVVPVELLLLLQHSLHSLTAPSNAGALVAAIVGSLRSWQVLRGWANDDFESSLRTSRGCARDIGSPVLRQRLMSQYGLTYFGVETEV